MGYRLGFRSLNVRFSTAANYDTAIGGTDEFLPAVGAG
jgi:hypothetical protein